MREAIGLALHCNGLPGVHRLHQRPTHHRTERCRPTRLHHQSNHTANGGTTTHNRHEQIATPQGFRAGRARFAMGLGLRLEGEHNGLRCRLEAWKKT
ncbi:hypothetical protein [Vulcanococcus sp.]|uniref:hypothetical protein n=1 Tax=Vulcanococcus sp. TaxID=2856995 RepID=UPI003F69774B